MVLRGWLRCPRVRAHLSQLWEAVENRERYQTNDLDFGFDELHVDFQPFRHLNFV